MERAERCLSMRQVMEVYEPQLTAAEADQALRIAVKTKKLIEHRREYTARLCEQRVFQVRSYEEIKEQFYQMFEINEGAEFQETEFNKDILHTLCLYFSKDKRFEELKKSYSLDKGIILQGPIGACKTSMLKSFQQIGFRGFGIESCRQIESLYDEQGFGAVEKYGTLRIDPYKRECGWLLDDLGWEEDGKHYGKSANVLERIFEVIESKRVWRAMLLTTNYGVDKLRERYGDRVLSRMKMMFNQISYSPESPDMRS